MKTTPVIALLLVTSLLGGCAGSNFRYRTNDPRLAAMMQRMQSKTAEAVKCAPGDAVEKKVSASTTKRLRNGKTDTAYSGSMNAECR